VEHLLHLQVLLHESGKRPTSAASNGGGGGGLATLYMLDSLTRKVRGRGPRDTRDMTGLSQYLHRRGRCRRDEKFYGHDPRKVAEFHRWLLFSILLPNQRHLSLKCAILVVWVLW